MILHRSTPVFIGTLLIFGIGGLLTYYSPLPGELSEAHAHLGGTGAIEQCTSCHTESGFATGCLGCHTEIQEQLAGRRGYHFAILQGQALECEGCHAEHNGRSFFLTNTTSWGAQTPRAFKHSHVDFELVGAHTSLACQECHLKELPSPFHLPGYPDRPRQHTYLGLTQECEACHEDNHSSGLTGDCRVCHGQDTFRPTEGFDHREHFSLSGAHAGVDCGGCHVLPPPGSPKRPFPHPFERVRGKDCASCHDSPHRSLVVSDCAGCHDAGEPSWDGALASVTAQTHAKTGFRLVAPHDEVECKSCHPRDLPFPERYPDPQTAGYERREETCEGCHDDAHFGQFAGRHDRCIDCHQKHTFEPPAFARDDHAEIYPLDGGHAAVACNACHLPDRQTRVRRFADTTRSCKHCHDSPHGEQFASDLLAGDCDNCHSGQAPSFHLPHFPHERLARYPLHGAHSQAECNDCHVPRLKSSEAGVARVRRYRGTPTDCDACHHDAHRGQFHDAARSTCSDCHPSFSAWDELRFDHTSDTRFPLEGVHAQVACSRCHKAVDTPDGEQVVQYKPLGRECADCHEIPRR